MHDQPASTLPTQLLEPDELPVPKSPKGELTAEARAIMAEESPTYEPEYDQAVIDLHQEHRQSLGLLDTVKTMFMWMESPEERISKNRSHGMDPT